MLLYIQKALTLHLCIYCKQFVLCVAILNSLLAHSQELQEADWSLKFSPASGIIVLKDSIPQVKIGMDAECGASRDAALYASFGVEAQIFNCSKIVVSVMDQAGESPTENNNWLFKIDFAFLYEQIQKIELPDIIYAQDSFKRDIDGHNRYFDWYKNLGSRVYYIGDSPLIEAYIGYKTPAHSIKLGRLKGIIGLEDHEVFFKDDGKFAPYQYWLSRELTAGFIYSYNMPLIEFSIAITSGSNPIKGYSYYLDGVIGPNLKGNNTPSISHKIKFNYAKLFGDKFNGYIFFSGIKAKIGSTYIVGTNYGKRNNSIDAYGATFSMAFDHAWLNSLHLFAQFSNYFSGLSEDSAQNNGSLIFLDIEQAGYFIGAKINLLQRFELGLAYEEFDRFDFNIYEYYAYSIDNPYYFAKQRSKIVSFRYVITPALSFDIGYHSIDNPAPFVSNILDTRGDTKVKLTLALEF